MPRTRLAWMQDHGSLRLQLVDAAAVGAPAAVLEALASGFTSYTQDFTEGVNGFRNKTTPHFTAS
jgi:hypothetical protein